MPITKLIEMWSFLYSNALNKNMAGKKLLSPILTGYKRNQASLKLPGALPKTKTPSQAVWSKICVETEHLVTILKPKINKLTKSSKKHRGDMFQVVFWVSGTSRCWFGPPKRVKLTGSKGRTPINLWELELEIRLGFHVPTGVIIWYQPKLHALLFSGHSLKITHTFASSLIPPPKMGPIEWPLSNYTLHLNSTHQVTTLFMDHPHIHSEPVTATLGEWNPKKHVHQIPPWKLGWNPKKHQWKKTCEIMAIQPTPPGHVPPPRNKGLIRPY